MIAAFIVIAVVFDVSEKIDDFIKNDVPVKRIFFEYYLNFIFYMGMLLSPILVFLTVILVTSNMAQKSEVVAILAGNISYRRMLLPFIIAASLLTLVSLVIAHAVLPKANKVRLAFEEGIVVKRYYITDENLLREIEPGTIAYFQSIIVYKNVGYKFSLEKWDELGRLRYKLIASKAMYLPDKNSWQLTNVQERHIEQDGSEKISHSLRKDTLLNMRLEDFGKSAEVAMAMSGQELTDFIDSERKSGSNKTTHILIEKYNRTANSFAIIILTIIGVSVSSRKTRGGTGLHIALGVLIGFIYIFALKISAVSATNMGVPPIIAVWIPNILFLGIAFYLYRKAPK
jgi:lipopolysaccharide export system permease protein